MYQSMHQSMAPPVVWPPLLYFGCATASRRLVEVRGAGADGDAPKNRRLHHHLRRQDEGSRGDSQVGMDIELRSDSTVLHG